MYSQILSSYNATSTLPEFITVTPWSIVSNSSTVFITTDQIKNASQTVKSYVDTNHTLPSNVTISRTAVTMPQFLKLTAKAIINIESYLNTSIILDNAGTPTGPAENITSGTIFNDEFVDIANYIRFYMDSQGTAPNNVTNTSIGDTMRYESLIYMFSNILTSYSATEDVPDEVPVIPWLALSNPNGTFNYIILFLIFYILLRFIHQKKIISLINTDSKVDWGRIVKGAGIWFTIMAFGTLIFLIISPSSFEVTFNPTNFFFLLILSILIFSIQAPFEELFFRGYLMQGIGLLTKTPIIPLILTSVLFAVLHY